jgi:hypothetical protein
MCNISKGDIVIAPQVENDYLTPNKEYEIVDILAFNGFVITDNTGESLFCKKDNDGHLNGLDWEFKK